MDLTGQGCARTVARVTPSIIVSIVFVVALVLVAIMAGGSPRRQD